MALTQKVPMQMLKESTKLSYHRGSGFTQQSSIVYLEIENGSGVWHSISISVSLCRDMEM